MSVKMANKQKGMTLLEVLISIVVLAIGLLGIASMLMLSSKANNSSYTKQQAVQSVYNIFDRIRANSSSGVSGAYNVSNIGGNGMPTSVGAPAALCNVSACNTNQIAAYDTWFWLTQDVAKLPNGSGSIITAPSGASGNTIITVTVQWDDSPAQSKLGSSSPTAASNANFVQLSIQSQL